MRKSHHGIDHGAAAAMRWAALVLIGALLACAPARLPERFASPENDAVLALALEGDAAAQAALGEMFEEGRGGAPDYAAAAQWYRRAADQGDGLAAYRLGQLHEQGTGVARDAAEAVRWYRLAAERGSESAAFRLGQLYEYGIGVRRDVTQALAWYQRAAAGWRARSAYPLAPDHVLAGLEADTEAPGPLADSGPRVHLASFRSADEAVAAWGSLRDAYPEVLGGLGLALARLDLGQGVGVFYQVQAGPFADLDAAGVACARLHAQGQFCQPVP